MKPPTNVISTLKSWRRNAAELVGVSRWSRPALNGLDAKLERWVDRERGFFVEAGANDGFEQSNTYYFERMRSWNGILIEPIPALCARCRQTRRRSIVVNAALVAPNFPDAEIAMRYAGLMSVSEGAFGDPSLRDAHVAVGLQQHGVGQGYEIRVPARTLSSILDEHASGSVIDLLSLDVEGAELTALQGLDLGRHAPRFICVEARNRDAVASLLASRYELADVLHDSGTHQDLLFRCR